MITLYQRTDCPFCWKVRLALAELGLDYQSVDTALGEKHPEVTRLSPTGTVPVMVDDEVVIWDSSVMVEYLDNRYAEGQLVPGSPQSKAVVRLMHAYSDKLVGPALRGLVFEKRAKPQHHWDLKIIHQSEQDWRDCLVSLERQLGVKDFFGVTFSAADCALAVRFGVAEVYGAGVSRDFSGLSKWYSRVTMRASWELAYPTGFIGGY